MAGQSFAMFGWSWTEVSVLGSQVFGRALMESLNGELQRAEPSSFIFVLNVLEQEYYYV